MICYTEIMFVIGSIGKLQKELRNHVRLKSFCLSSPSLFLRPFKVTGIYITLKDVFP